MAAWSDVRTIARELPGAQERTGRDGGQDWAVRDKAFVWERPLRKGDLEALGNAAPVGPVIGLRTADEGVKQALVASVRGCFTTPHFTGYPAVLVALDVIDADDLAELIVESWLLRVTKRVARDYLDARGDTTPRTE